ncbi:hypothetical protein [Bacillus pumilus]|uniref:hypothetical protein n=1 Tax=Bacillus pumilus TaxID=1408 RepID=UPI0011AA0ECB|nr:hypothetical protein [Bacillus pumilus]
MYASKGVVFHFAVDSNVVITVYKEKDNAGSKAKHLLIDAYNIVQKNASEAISKTESFLEELDKELRWLDEELKRTRSKAKRMALQARINAVQMRVDELPAESLEIKRKVTRYAKGVAVYV